LFGPEISFEINKIRQNAGELINGPSTFTSMFVIISPELLLNYMMS